MITEYQQEGSESRNTGAAEQFLEGTTIRHTLATAEQEFATKDDAKDLDNWKADRALKKLIPLFEIEELAQADTEDKKWEGREKVYTTASGKKVRTFNCMLGVLSHRDLKSYDGKKMRVYEHTDKGEILGTTPDDVKVKGQLVTIKVGRRSSAMPDKPAFTPVTLTYADHNEFEESAVILRPDWSQIEFEGIYDVVIKQVGSATSSLIKFNVKTLAGDAVTSLTDSDLILKNADGTTKAHTFVPADADGTYSFTGTGFVTGSTIELNGVVSQTEADYEAVEPGTVTI